MVMDIEAFTRREKMLKLREELLPSRKTVWPVVPGLRRMNWTAIWKALLARQNMEKKPEYKEIVSDRCRQMLASHVRFLAQKNPAAARRVKNDLMDAIRSLYKMPERFSFLDTVFIPPNKYHKMFVEKWYLILYQIKGEAVYVDYIVDCRQDYGWLVR